MRCVSLCIRAVKNEQNGEDDVHDGFVIRKYENLPRVESELRGSGWMKNRSEVCEVGARQFCFYRRCCCVFHSLTHTPALCPLNTILQL